MKPAAFRYSAPSTLTAALDVLAANPDAKPLAGGQSLVPMLNFRLLEPALLVDLNRIAGLDAIEATAHGVRIGALARHRAVLESAVVRARVPVLTAAMAEVAHFGVRNRGTTGGSLAHADPAAEIPLVATLLDARIEIASPAGSRSIVASEFFTGPLATVLAPGELVVAVEYPAAPSGWSFEEFARRAGDYALCAVAVHLSAADGRGAIARIALGRVGPTPLRARAAEALLTGRIPDAAAIAAAAQAAAREDARPDTDLHASAAFRRHLVAKLVARSIDAAWRRTA